MESTLATGELLTVYKGMLESVRQIGVHLRHNNCAKIETANSFGDHQLDLDVHTDAIIFDCLKKTGLVYAGVSEEQPVLTVLNEEGKYIVTFDPLDGSSIVDCNFTVGSIFAIWPKGDLTEMTAKDMLGACISLYGSKTNCVIYNQITNQVDEWSLVLESAEDGYKWHQTQKNLVIRPKGKIFSPGNTRACKENPNYYKAIKYWLHSGYTLRYSGGMAPDCFHVFKKGEGIFSSVSQNNPKLRVLYEVLPIAFLAEKAGGVSSDGEKSLMDLKITGFTQKSDIIIGSREEVERLEKFLAAGKQMEA